MTISFLFAVVVQAQPVVPRTCALLAPAGEAIVFNVAPGARGSAAALVPAEGSAWPSTIASARLRGGTAGGFGLIVGGEGGVVLDIAEPAGGQRRATAIVSRWNGSRGVLPLAFGFCVADAAAPSAGQASGAVATDVPAFDPERWPNDCALLLGDGQRHRLSYHRRERGDGVTIQGPALWNGRAVTARLREGGGGQARFEASGDGPAGSELLQTDGRRASKIIHFQRTGDPSSPDMPAYAICGYRQVVRLPNRE